MATLDALIGFDATTVFIEEPSLGAEAARHAHVDAVVRLWVLTRRWTSRATVKENHWEGTVNRLFDRLWIGSTIFGLDALHKVPAEHSSFRTEAAPHTLQSTLVRFCICARGRARGPAFIENQTIFTARLWINRRNGLLDRFFEVSFAAIFGKDAFRVVPVKNRSFRAKATGNALQSAFVRDWIRARRLTSRSAFIVYHAHLALANTNGRVRLARAFNFWSAASHDITVAPIVFTISVVVVVGVWGTPASNKGTVWAIIRFDAFAIGSVQQQIPFGTEASHVASLNATLGVGIRARWRTGRAATLEFLETVTFAFDFKGAAFSFWCLAIAFTVLPHAINKVTVYTVDRNSIKRTCFPVYLADTTIFT